MGDFKDILIELITKYDHYKKTWMDQYGNDDGFNEWFTKQIDRPLIKQAEKGGMI